MLPAAIPDHQLDRLAQPARGSRELDVSHDDANLVRVSNWWGGGRTKKHLNKPDPTAVEIRRAAGGR